MKLHKSVLTLTMAVSCILPLAGIMGCTGPIHLHGHVHSNSTDSNTTHSSEIDDTQFSGYNSNTTY